MIAAGSLFTSCVTNTEPQGIKDIREAKANYLDALAELRKADAELVRANVAYREAEVAYQQAQNKLAELKVAYEQAWTDAEVAKIKAAAEKAAVDAEKALALAEQELQEALWNIAVKSKELTETEKKAITAYTTAYQEYIDAVDKLRYAEKSFDDAEYNTDGKYAAMLQQGKADSAKAQASIAKWSSAFDNYLATLPDSGEAYLTVQKMKEDYKADSAEVAYVLANIEKDWALYQSTEVDASIKGFSTELVDWVVKNVKLPAPFEMHYKTELPDNDQVVDLLAKYVNEYNVPGVKVIDKATAAQQGCEENVLTANFNSTPQATEGIEKLGDIIDALSRECVVDGTKAGYDTTGMGAAVAAAEKEYKETLDALTKGVMEYPDVKEAIEAYNAAIADSTAKKVDLDTAVSRLQSTWKALCTVYASTSQGSIEAADLYAKEYYGAFQNAIVAFAKARKAYFGDAAPNNQEDGRGFSLDKIAICSGYEIITHLPKFDTVEIADLDSDDFAPISAGEGKFITFFDVDNPASNSLMARMHAYNVVLQRLLPYVGKDKKWYTRPAEADYTNETVYPFPSFMFSTPVVEKGKVIRYDAYRYVAGDSKTPSDYFAYDQQSETTSKVKTFTPANLVGKYDAQIDAQKDYYENVYNKFWGKANAIDIANTTAKWDTEKVRFINPEQDSLKAKFVVETFTDPTIVHFTGTESGVYNYDAKTKKGSFNVSNCSLERNTELDVVIAQLKANMGQELEFDHILLFDLFCKQQIRDEYSLGSVGVAAALEALQAIYPELVAEFAAAVKAQSDNSQPFYKFVEDLVGKETLDYIFKGLDSALTVYAQHAPARAEGENQWVDLANAIAAKELTSKEALIIAFEKFMCGELKYSVKNIFRFFGNARADVPATNATKAAVVKSYRAIYTALQVADAFSGDQFRALLSDVLTAFINSIPVDIVATDKLFEGFVGDNIIEKILFGTVRYALLNEGDAFAIFFSIITKNHMALIPTAVKIFAPAIVPYLTQDFGGKIEEFQVKYFSEWAEAWSTYDIARAEIEAEQEVIDKIKRILKTYEGTDAIKAIEAVKTKAEAELAKAKDALKVANAKIEAALAGPSWDETRWAQFKLDQLEAAKLAVETAEAKLEAAEAAYKQVLANHGLAE